jgi:hypothetical protein
MGGKKEIGTILIDLYLYVVFDMRTTSWGLLIFRQHGAANRSKLLLWTSYLDFS